MIKSNCNLTPEVSSVNLRRWITPGDFVFPRVEIHLNTKALLDRDKPHIHNDKTLSYFLKNCSEREPTEMQPFKSQNQCCKNLQISSIFKNRSTGFWISKLIRISIHSDHWKTHQLQRTMNSHWGKLQKDQRIHELLRYRCYIRLWRKRKERKSRREGKRNLNLVQKERREDADCGGGGRQGSARGKGLCVFYIYNAQMLANVNS